MKVYHEQCGFLSEGTKYIVLSEQDNIILGLTINQMLIVVDSSNRRIREFPCPEEILEAYKKRLKEAKSIPDYQVCLFFGAQITGTEDDI